VVGWYGGGGVVRPAISTRPLLLVRPGGDPGSLAGVGGRI